jgi:hypothetical protein
MIHVFLILAVLVFLVSGIYAVLRYNVNKTTLNLAAIIVYFLMVAFGIYLLV